MLSKIVIFLDNLFIPKMTSPTLLFFADIAGTTESHQFLMHEESLWYGALSSSPCDSTLPPSFPTH